MDKTALSTTLPDDLSEPASPATATAPRGSLSGLVRSGVRAIASLRLTVVLFVLSFILVFVGTLAMMDNGLYAVLNEYFRAAFVKVPFQVFVRFGQVFLHLPQGLTVPGWFPFPGGWLLGGLLLTNLLAAHLTRFKFTWKRSGILILHAGLVVMMVSEYVTGKYAVEGRMTIREGGSSNYLEHWEVYEVAVTDTSDPKVDTVTAIPLNLLRKAEKVSDDSLPFEVALTNYLANTSVPRPAQPGEVPQATAGLGAREVVKPESVGKGVDSEQKIDVPAVFVQLREKATGQMLGTYLLSAWDSGSISELHGERLQQVQSGGKSYDLVLRPKRTYKPYTIHLLEFKHEKYVGTPTPKNFSSKIRLEDPSRNEERETLIYMNNPLRYPLAVDGETFFQSGYLQVEKGTILQVVRNPGWLMPYVSCGMVFVGMMVHFSLQFSTFLSRRFAA